jgi:hypothetical protein
VSIVGKSGKPELESKMTVLRDTWESTSFALEMMQVPDILDINSKP